MIHTDVLVIGSGAAGLVYAIKVARKCPDKRITIVTKSDPEESNTRYAQGGVAVVLDKVKDNFEQHVEDTLRAGDGECIRSVVEMVIKDAPTRIMELVKWGVTFDLDMQGNYDLGREGGHSHNRVIHHKDNTGEAIELVLLKKASKYNNITLLDHHLAVDLLLTDDEKTCIGADVLDIKEGRLIRMLSLITVLATGGCGHVYENTTNPMTSTGDGIALAERAKAKISNMQYIQFHPTALFEDSKGKLALITEAMRGAGAKLLNSEKEPFMHKYDDREELASRDIVSKAIYSEMKLHKSSFIYLDCRFMDIDIMQNHFPNIYQDCKERGYNLHTDLLPIVPASHYLCGGINVDMDGETSLANLYAIGECSNTGLHGANRLASNSLLEALVYGHRAAGKTDSLLNGQTREISDIEIKRGNLEHTELESVQEIRTELNSLMSKCVGIVRNNMDLLYAKEKCSELEQLFASIYGNDQMNVEAEEVRNLLCVARIIIQQSIDQKSNAGTFYNIDLNGNN